MEYLTTNAVFPLLREYFNLHEVIKVRVIHLSGVGESAVDQPISEFERMSNPTVGLLAHPGIVDIRITAKADDLATAETMIRSVESQIAALFPDDIFGYDDQTLADSLLGLVKSFKRKLNIKTCGLSENLSDSFQNTAEVCVQSLPNQLDFNTLALPVKNSEIDFICNYYESAKGSHLEYLLQDGGYKISNTMIYNGPQAQGKTWAVNRAMDILRRYIKSITH